MTQPRPANRRSHIIRGLATVLISLNAEFAFSRGGLGSDLGWFDVTIAWSVLATMAWDYRHRT